MSWLFGAVQSNGSHSTHPHSTQTPVPAPEHSPRGRDLAAIRHSFGRQLRGVAAFLAPPPPSAAAETAPPTDGSPDSVLVGIRNDLAEIGGSLRAGLSLLSSNKAVSEISRLASSLLQLQGGGDGGGAVGIDGEIVAFVKEISAVPACWTDFPLALDNDFCMSDGQREHALAIEHLIPRLGVLRVKLRGYISDEQFWMIYFILLLPRLSGRDFELLSTPKIIQARDALLQKLQNSPSRENALAAAEVEKETDAEDGTGQWLEDTDDTNTSLVVQRSHEHEGDVSFSDFDRDDDNDLPGRSSTHETGYLSPTGSSDWVQLKNESCGLQKTGRIISRGRESESDGSNGWLTVDDFD